MEESNKDQMISNYYLYLQHFYNLNRRLLLTQNDLNDSDFAEYTNILNQLRKTINDKE